MDLLARVSSDMSKMKPVRTFGPAHLALGVVDPAGAFDFYRMVFAMVAVYEEDDFIQAQTPGSRDVLLVEGTHRLASTAVFTCRVLDLAWHVEVEAIAARVNA